MLESMFYVMQLFINFLKKYFYYEPKANIDEWIDN